MFLLKHKQRQEDPRNGKDVYRTLGLFEDLESAKRVLDLGVFTGHCRNGEFEIVRIELKEKQ